VFFKGENCSLQQVELLSVFLRRKIVPDNRLCSTLQLGHGCHSGIPCTDTDAEERKTKREMARAF
jgi:hypothetical protein